MPKLDESKNRMMFLMNYKTSKVLSEQSDMTKVFGPTASKPDSKMADAMTKVYSAKPVALPHVYKCLSIEKSEAVVFAKSDGLDPFFIKYGLGILGRESDWGKLSKMYLIKSPFEYAINKVAEFSPGVGEIIKWGAKKLKNKENWVPSMGIAQMTPDVAKKYNINLEELMTLSGSLVASTKYLKDLYTQTKEYYSTTEPTIIMWEEKLQTNPRSTGNAALDIAIVSYNTGFGKYGKKFCKTNSKELLGPCNSKTYQPYDSKPDYILNVYQDQMVENYFPRYEFKGASSHGYLKEVVGYVKGYGCIK